MNYVIFQLPIFFYLTSFRNENQPQKGVRKIERKEYKYVIRSYEPFIEEKAKTFIQAVSAIKKMKVSGIKHYEVIRIPFRERHPNFPIYFSIAALMIISLRG